MADIASISYEGIATVTPSDTVANVFAGFVASTTGVLTFTDWRGVKVTGFPVVAGLLYSIPVRVIWATGNTGGTIFGLIHARYLQ